MPLNGFHFAETAYEAHRGWLVSEHQQPGRKVTRSLSLTLALPVSTTKGGRNLIKPIFDDALLKEGDDDVDFMIYLHAQRGVSRRERGRVTLDVDDSR